MSVKLQERLILLISVFTGFCVVGVEVTSSRLLAPYFGSSIIVWSGIIGVVLLSLAIGYYLGGKISERYPSIKVLLKIIFSAGVFFLLVPWIAKPVSFLANSGLQASGFNGYFFFSAIFLVALVLFGIPLIFLGMTSPLMVKIYSLLNGKPGEAAGQIFALSTMGSVVGTFIPTLILIPNYGTRTTIIIFAGILIILGSFGFSIKKSVMTLLVLLIILFGLFSFSKNTSTAGIIYQGESAYQFLRVLEDKDQNRYLLSNEGIGYESIYNKNKALVGTFYDYFNALPILLGSKEADVLVVGLAGATIPRQMNYFFKDQARIDGVEIDSKVIDLANKYFDLQNIKMNVINQEGRMYLTHTSKKYDIIIIDAFQNELYIPWTLTTAEFWQVVKSKLNNGGIVAININSGAKDSKLFQAITNTQASVFKNVYLANSKDQFNSLVVASDQALDFNKLATISDKDLAFLATLSKDVVELSYSKDKMVLTDDRAPTELMTDKIILNYKRALAE